MTTRTTIDQGRLEPVRIRERDSLTTAPPRDDALRIHRQLIRTLMRRHLDASDDFAIAVIVRERDATDTGERIGLEDFLIEHGFEPSELEAS